MRVPTRVLVVDDDAEAREAMSNILRDAGYDVVTASDGREALHYLVSGSDAPAAIILDLDMPVMNGLQLMMVLLSYQRLATIPIVVMSAADDRFASPTNAVARLRKPIKRGSLLPVVSAVTFARGTRPPTED